MGGHLGSLLTAEHDDHFGAVDWQPLVWVDADAEETGVSLKKIKPNFISTVDEKQ